MTRRESMAIQRSETDAELVRLTDELTNALESGEAIDLDAFVAAHVEHAHELRRVFPAIQALVGLGSMDDAADAATTLNEAAPLRTLGDFRIVRELGRGGMGMVYEAEQTSLARRVALKVLPLAATLSPQQLERFKNEARAAATLKHPHIVGVYSVGVERGVHYYAMELVEGHSLAQVVVELRDRNLTSELPPGSAAPAATETATAAALSTVRTTNPQQYYRHIAQIIGDAAEALDYAHNRGVLHRDIKPANLLVDANSHVWITDFGLARLEADAGVTLTGDVVGTLRYMSPEQAAGKAGLVDYRTDIHALGATLFELLSLRPAFPGDDRAELLRQVAETAPPSLRKVVPRLPVDLETIVAKAMEKDPADRYQSAGEMAADLRAFIEHRAITARPPSVATRAQKWVRHHVALVILALTALVLVAAMLGLALASIHRAQSATVAALDDAQDKLHIARLAVDQMYADVATEWLADELALTPTKRDFLEKALRIYERLAEEAHDDPQSQWEAGTSRGRVAHIQHKLGQYREAASSYERTIATFAPLLARSFDNNPERRAELAAAYQDMGRLHLTYEELAPAKSALQNADAILASLAQEFPQVGGYQQGLALNQLDRAELLLRDGKSADAERLMDAAGRVFVDLRKRAPTEVEFRLGHLRSQTGLARVLRLRGDLSGAEPLAQQAVSECAFLADEMPDSRPVRKAQVAALTELADVLTAADRFDDAASHLRTALAIALQSLRGQMSPNALLIQSVTHGAEWGRYAEPEPFREYLEIQIRLGVVVGRLGRFYESQQLLADAIRTAYILSETYLLPQFTIAEANARFELAELLRRESHPEARAVAATAATEWRQLLKQFPHSASYLTGLSGKRDWNRLLQEFPEPSAATTAATPPATSTFNGKLACLGVTLGVSWLRGNDAQSAVAFLDKFRTAESGGDSYAWFYLAMALERRGDHEQALEHYHEAVAWLEQHKPENVELLALQKEAALALGLPSVGTASANEPPP